MIENIVPHVLRWKTLRALVACIALATCARAQFYAPDTFRHDPVQRVYPVELARILGWLHNQQGDAQVTEITFNNEPAAYFPRITTIRKPGQEPVVTVQERAHTWTLRWLGADKQLIRQFNLSYSDADLEAGAGFYRELLNQFRKQGAAPTLTTPASAPTADPVYEGLAALDTNRLLTLHHATALYADLTAAPDTAQARKLAGQLLATASFGLGGQQTLDTTLAARAAVWLALSEATPTDDAPWAVLLALNHRTRQAQTHWKNPSAENAPPTWWSLLIEKSYADKLALGAIQVSKSTHALPLYAAAARQKMSATLYGDFLKLLFENDPRALLSAYDQSPWLYQSGNIETGHMSNGAWTTAARTDWINALIACPADKRLPSITDALLTTALRAQKTSTADIDASLTGIQETTPILEIAIEQARTPLAPVAALTFADLLHHGWETQALHLAARHHFLNSRYGDRALGAKYKAALDSTGAGLASMLAVDDESPAKPVPSPAHDLLGRIEAAGGLRSALVKLEPDAGLRREAYNILHRSFWLSPDNTSRCFTHSPSPITNSRTGHTYNIAHEYLELLSTLGNVELCRRAALIVNSERSLERYKITDEHLAQITRHLSPEDSLWTTLNRDNLDAMPEHERARTLETYYWDNPGEALGKQVYQAYIAAHDLASARRFYDQIRVEFGGSVSFSNNIGPVRLMRAILDEDEVGIKTALLDSDTGSAPSLMSRMMVATHQRNPEALKKIIETSLNRYPIRTNNPQKPAEPNSRELLLKFVPLWPALADPKHPDHAKALDHFGSAGDWPSFRWVLADRLNLSTEDRIRFFGGENACTECRLFIAYLRRDIATFEKLYADLGAPSKRQLQSMSHVIVHQLRADLLQLQPPPSYNIAEPEPKLSLQQQVATAYKEKNTSNLRRTLEKIPDADALWTHLTKPASQSQGTVPLSAQQLSAGLTLLIEKYPDSARRWDARLLLAQLGHMQALRTGQRGQIDQSILTFKQLSEDTAAPSSIRASARLLAVLGNPYAPDRGVATIRSWIAEFPEHHSQPVAHLRLGLLLQDTDSSAALAAFIQAEKSSDKSLADFARIHRSRLELMAAPITLQLTTLDGASLDLTALRGKVILIDFWATWCGPCVAEMPTLAALYDKYQSAGLEIIGISQDRDRATLEKFIEAKGLKWPQVHEIPGSKNSTAMRYGVFSYPTKWLVDRKGHARILEHGTDLDAALQAALNAK